LGKTGDTGADYAAQYAAGLDIFQGASLCGAGDAKRQDSSRQYGSHFLFHYDSSLTW
jgi:hypothetical protein